MELDKDSELSLSSADLDFNIPIVNEQDEAIDGEACEEVLCIYFKKN